MDSNAHTLEIDPCFCNDFINESLLPSLIPSNLFPLFSRNLVP